MKVDEGVYSSAWWSQDVRVRRCVALLGGQLNRRVVFTAGPFTELSVATFVTVFFYNDNYYFNYNKKKLKLFLYIIHNYYNYMLQTEIFFLSTSIVTMRVCVCHSMNIKESNCYDIYLFTKVICHRNSIR